MFLGLFQYTHMHQQPREPCKATEEDGDVSLLACFKAGRWTSALIECFPESRPGNYTRSGSIALSLGPTKVDPHLEFLRGPPCG